MYACPSSSTSTVGSMSKELWFAVVLSISGLPSASWNGPSGLSPTATPIDIEFVAAFCIGRYQ